VIEATERGGVNAGRRTAGKSSMWKAAIRKSTVGHIGVRKAAGVGKQGMPVTEVVVIDESRTV